MSREPESQRTAADQKMGVDEAIGTRRSVRRFDRTREVPREVLLEVMDAGRWAPSSCNLQTWDFVVVEDDDLRARLSEETKSVLIAPATIFVVYDRELAREGEANIQSASAAVMTMLLKATSLGLASLWVNALGDRARVREMLGVPEGYEVMALVCLGYPKDQEPPPAPDRRPIDDVVHWNAYSGRGSLPRSPDPDDWTLEEIALYFKRKLQSGTRYNKPVASFFDPVMDEVRRLLEPHRQGMRLLDVLSGAGIFTEALYHSFSEAEFTVMELGADSHFFAARRAGGKVGFAPFPKESLDTILSSCAAPGEEVRVARESGGLPVIPRMLPRPNLVESGFNAATILFRLEGIPSSQRPELLKEVFDRLDSGATVLIAYTSRRSWHWPAYALRRRLGRDSVEYAPSPEPNVIGPYEALSPASVRRLAKNAGFTQVAERTLLPLPDPGSIGPGLERAGGVFRLIARVMRFVVACLSPVSALFSPWARVRIICLKRP